MRAVCRNCHESYEIGSIFGTRQLLLSYCTEVCAVADGMSAEDAHTQFEQRVSLGELHERRRLFIQAMRHPEMRLLRAALKDLKWEHCIDWCDVTKLEMAPYSQGCCMIVTDHHMSVCLDTATKYPYFHVMRLHDAEDEFCECEDCQDSRLCYIRCKDVYIEQASA